MECLQYTWKKSQSYSEDVVLNLVINGMPSIPLTITHLETELQF